MVIPNLREHTAAVVSALEAAGLTVFGGPNGAPPSAAVPPYAVVYHLNDIFFGTLEEPDEDADLVYQVTCVGKSDEQAEWVMDRAMVLVEGFEVEGRSITRVRPDGGPGPRPDYDVSPVVFYATPRFTIKSTPAPLEVSA